ncbi:receptor [Enterobacteriaceae bacterium BIT-l23]|uniref:receptor n=1 Tax=Jejubacter sp. L23 TaxID=3092086 RepID=UPI0015850E0A|nr:receptor [Enterobacteriaceae bacterium BIT-l23]
MKKLFALNLLLLAAAAQADMQLNYIAIKNPDHTGSSNTAALFNLDSSSAAFLHGSFEWPTLSNKVNNGVITYIPDNLFSGPAGSPLTINFSVSGSSASPFFKGTACTTCKGSGVTALNKYSDASMVVQPPVLEPAAAYGRWVLGDGFFNYLQDAAPGNEVIISSTPQANSVTGNKTTTNTLHKLGNISLTNNRALNLGIDPISGEITIVDSATGESCTKYTRNTISGVLCKLMEYTWDGEDISGYSPGLSLVNANINPILESHMTGNTGLAAEMTFDEKLWFGLSGGSLNGANDFAKSFLTAPLSSGGKAYLKIFLPRDLILSIAQKGDGENIGNIVSLCLNPAQSTVAADFCFQPGGKMSIQPIEPGLEIRPDNPDYALDPNGFGGSGSGVIGEGPIEIPYTITYSGAQSDVAVAVNVKVTGPTRSLDGADYCAFSGNGFTVPIPGNMLVGKSRTLMAHNCKGEEIAIPAPATHGEEWDKVNSGVTDVWLWKTPLVLQFVMDNPVSQLTYEGNSWFGEVTAQGRIDVSASWE